MIGDQGNATVEVMTDGATQRVVVSGSVDVRTVPDLRLALHRLIDERQGPIYVDLGGAHLGDATALGMLVECHRRSGRQGRTMTFVNVCERGQRLLRAVRLHPRATVPAT